VERETSPLVLVVDDEPDQRELLSITLGRMGVQSVPAEDVKSARRALGQHRFQLCLTDLNLPDGDGLEIVEWIQGHSPDTPIAVITAHGNVEAAVKALKLGAFDFLSKPVDVSDLRRLVQQAIRAANGRQRQRGSRLLGESVAMARLREMIARVARSQAPVLISGESGTGKELVARLIHESGSRAEGPFIAVNCGAIPSELMESELFGHRKGSFTGATADKPGLVQAAEGGTLFLDEVAELPLPMQVKLLRLIQEKAVRPVGEQRETPIDVRILSATHRDLGERVSEGCFREDLFYRLNVIELAVPPLRQRMTDIPILAESILDRLSDRMGHRLPELSPAALENLMGYTFPGNVRELENILERATTLCQGDQIGPEDIQLRHLGGGGDRAGAAVGGDPDLDSAIEDITRTSIVRALEENRYNKTATARQLGITFRSLRYRIKKLGIE
jgi:two-component system response regulator PilR (NtrC family)